MKIKYSFLLPVHNEADWLPYALPSMFALEPDEIVLLLDRCYDNSRDVAYSIAARYNKLHVLTCIEVTEDSPEWKTRLGYLRTIGRKVARNNLLFFTGADLILDPKIKNILELLGKNRVQLITFMYKDYPPRWSNMLKRFFIKFGGLVGIEGLGFHKFLSGVMFYDRRIAWEVEDLESLKRCDHSCDTHLCMSINTKYRSKCVLTNTLHLRPRGNDRDYLRGRLYWSIARRGLLITLIASFAMLRLNMINGYLYERFRKHN